MGGLEIRGVTSTIPQYGTPSSLWQGETNLMRLGLFGGSFDPVHYGHLLLAECCREQCHLDKVVFLPAALPPHKRDRDLTSAELRIEMLRLAIAGHERFTVDSFEVERGGISYTVDTLSHYRIENPGAALFLLLGADMLHDLPRWHDASSVCELAVPVVVRRVGTMEPDFSCLAQIAPSDRIETFRRHLVEMPEIGLSSTDIRQRVATGRSIRYRTARSVEKFIETRMLYR